MPVVYKEDGRVGSLPSAEMAMDDSIRRRPNPDPTLHRPYDPLPDLIMYLVWSRRAMRMRASHAQVQLMTRLGITADMDLDEATELIREAIRQAHGGADDSRVKSSE